MTAEALPHKKASRMMSHRKGHGRPFADLRTVFFIASRQLWERKLLNSIAVGGVVLGVLTLIAMHGIMAGFQMKFTDAILKISPHVVINDTELRPDAPLLSRWVAARDGQAGPADVAAAVAHQTPTDRQARIKRPGEIVRALRQMPEVQGAATSIAGQVLIEYGGKTKSIDMRGIEIAEQERVTPLGPYVQSGSWALLGVANDGIAVGSGVASDLGLHVDNVVHAAAPGGQPMDLKVVAIYEAGIPPVDKNRAYVQLHNAQAILGRPDIVGRVEIRLHDPDRAVAFTSRIEKVFGYDAESWQETNANFLAIFAMQNMIMGFVVGAILAVGGFGILAIQVMIVLQKTRDIAILRSVGLRRVDILRIFLLQGVVIALVGGVIGDLLGKVALDRLALLKIKTEGLVKSDTFLIHEDPNYYVYGLLFALVVGTLASLIPAWRGSKVEPVDVLRGQIG